jgi:hypothetical protein
MTSSCMSIQTVKYHDITQKQTKWYKNSQNMKKNPLDP